MNKKNSLMKNTFIYMIGSFGTKILSFLLVPLYTYYIVTEEYGVYDIYYSVATLLIPVITISISEGAYRWLLDERNDKYEVLLLTFRILFISLCAFTGVYFGVIIFFPFEYSWLLYIFIISSAIYGTLLNIIRGMKKNTVYALLGVIQTGFILAFNILQIVVLKNGLKGLLLAQVFTYTISLLITIVIMCRYINVYTLFKTKHNKQMKRDMLKYSVPLIPNSINWWITNLSDRYMIKWILGLSYNGIYSVSCKFPSVVDMLTGFFSLAWQEEAITNAGKKGEKERFSDIFERYYLFLFSMITCAIPITYFYIKYLMQSDYNVAWKYTGLLYVGSVFHALANYLSVGYNISRNTKRITYTSMIAALSNIVVNIIFMKWIGVQAAAISTCVSYFLIFLIRYRDIRKMYEMHIVKMRFCGVLGISGIVCLLSYTENDILISGLLVLSVLFFICINRKLIFDLLKSIKKDK